MTRPMVLGVGLALFVSTTAACSSDDDPCVVPVTPTVQHGLYGIVTRLPDTKGARPVLVTGQVIVAKNADDSVANQTSSDDQGEYVLELAPGSYRLHAVNAFSDMDVAVPAGAPNRVDVGVSFSDSFTAVDAGACANLAPI